MFYAHTDTIHTRVHPVLMAHVDPIAGLDYADSPEKEAEKRVDEVLQQVYPPCLLD